MKKYFKPKIVIGLILLLLLLGIAYGINSYKQRGYYTIVDDGVSDNGLLEGVRCRAIGPMCE